MTLDEQWKTRGFLAREPEEGEDDRERLKVEQKLNRLLSKGSIAKLRKSFGLMGLPFFQYYLDLAKFYHTKQAPMENLFQELRQRVRSLIRVSKPSALVINKVSQILDDLKPWLRMVERNPDDVGAWRRVIKNFAPLLAEVAKDKGVYLKGTPVGAERWMMFRTMSPKEKVEEDIKDNDPVLYAAIQKQRNQLREVEKKIEADLKAEGMPYERKFLMGRTVYVGTDPVSKERVVYDWATQAVPIETYMQRRRDEQRASRSHSRVFPGKQALDRLRKVSDEEVDALPGVSTFASLTDDKAKVSALTRVFPIKKVQKDLPDGSIEEKSVVVNGRFKGFMLDDLVNAAGRMLEGTAYNYNPKSNRYDRIESIGAEGKLMVRAQREPYVTIVERKTKVRGQKKLAKQKKLYLKIPNSRAFTEVRRAVRKLSELVPSIEYSEQSRNTEFYFDPKDFNVVREALQGMAMSDGASKMLQRHFKQLAMAEEATAKENLGYYSMQSIGGFKSTVLNPGLLTKQKQALAWMEARGNNGVCALGTGVGKTLSSLAMMQKLKRDGLTEDGNGKFLYVCPTGLRGNLKKEAWKFLTDEERKDLVGSTGRDKGRVDILSYPQFTNAFRKNSSFADEYVAMFFDEAQALRSGTTKASRAALKIRHPRKILLTASPIEKEPMDAYVLAAISNNEDITPGTQGRRDMLKFQKRFTETVGGRTIGVKQEPLTKQDLQVWVKQNVFYGDKENVEEFELPKLTRETVALDMDPRIEAEYKETIGKFRDTFKSMVAAFQFGGKDPETGLAIPGASSARLKTLFSRKLAPLIKKLNGLANFPERFVDGATNLKMRESTSLVMGGLANVDARTILFSDDTAQVVGAAKHLSTQLPGTYHLAALGSEIQVYQNGKPLEEFLGFKMPFRPRRYKRYMDQPADPRTNRDYKKAEWQTFVFEEIATKNRMVTTCTLAGKAYSVGQNLQAFSQVIHLDRDSWNSEQMKQRTARAWRQGQQNPVKEFTLDVTYDSPTDEYDRTLDEIRAIIQQIDEKLFDDIIKESQVVALGEEWKTMDKMMARLFTLDEKAVDLAMGPYVKNSQPPRRGNAS